MIENDKDQERRTMNTDNTQNVSDQWLAPRGLSMPLGLIASPLHRVVRCWLRRRTKTSDR